MSEKLTTPGSMEIADRLEHCAKYTGLDAVRELLQEAAQAVRKRDAVIKLLEGERAQAAQAEVTDERQAFEAFAQNCPMGKYSITRRGDGYDSSHTQLMWDTWQARAILALRPAAVPMADEHLSVLKEMADRCPELNLSNYDSDDVDELNSWAVAIAVYIDGITAQAKKEGA